MTRSSVVGESTAEDSLATKVAVAAEPADPIAEAQLLADVEHRLFGRPRSQLRVARYILLDLIARGAFGLVYTAYDPRLDRRVAIKLLRVREEDDSDARARMLREAHALARLRHPNVVAIYDVGEYAAGEIVELDSPVVSNHSLQHAGVFIVMELVVGETLDAWLETRRRWQDVVARFIAAGRGLAAAHDNDLVHRDFKPQNVVVDSDGRTLVLDFGLARRRFDSVNKPQPRDRPRPDSASTPLDSRITIQGTVLGTPRYMAPEQHDGKVATAASDQYGFAVALYEALYHVRAFESSDGLSLAQAKHEQKLAPRPADTGVPSAVHRVLLRALHPSPSQRFPSMRELLAALEHAATRRRRLIRTVLTLAFAALAIAFGTVLARSPSVCSPAEAALHGVWDREVEHKARTAFLATKLLYAGDTWASVASSLDTYAHSWVEARDHACAEQVQSAAPDSGNAPANLLCLDRALHRVGGLTKLFESADAGIVEHALEAMSDLPDIRQCRLSSESRSLPVAPRNEVLAIESSIARATWLLRAMKLEPARAEAQVAVESARQLAYPPSVAAAELVNASVALRMGHHDEAHDAALEAISQSESVGDALTAVKALLVLVRLHVDRGHHETAETLADLARVRLASLAHQANLLADLKLSVGLLLTDEQRYDDAKKVLKEGLEISIGEHGNVHPQVAWLHNALGNVYEDAGDFDDARTQFERSIAIWQSLGGSSHPSVAVVLNNIANVEASSGNLAEAKQMYERSLAASREAFGPDHPSIGVVVHNLGWLAMLDGRLRDSLSFYSKAIDLRRRLSGGESPSTASSLHGRAETWLALGNCEEARADFQSALQTRTGIHGGQHPAVAASLEGVAEALRCAGRYEQAIEQHRRALDSLPMNDHSARLNTTVELARTYAEAGMWNEAKLVVLQAMAKQPPDLASEFSARTILALAHLRLGEAESAREELEVIRREVDQADKATAVDYLLVVAEFARVQNNVSLAEQSLAQAQARLDRHSDSDIPQLIHVDLTLANLLRASDRRRAQTLACSALRSARERGVTSVRLSEAQSFVEQIGANCP